MCEPRYNLANNPEAIPGIATNDESRGVNGPESAVNAQVLVDQAVSEPPSNHSKRASTRSWRRQNGPFVAQETGTLYKPEIGVYDQKPREKPARRDVPLTESQVTQERANLREDLKKPEDHPMRRTTLEGIWFWISAYMALSDEEKAALEGDDHE